MVFCFVVLLLTVAFLYCRVTKGIPSRLQADEAPKSEFGVVPVDGFGSDSRLDPNGVDIIFVHGLGSNPDTTWRARKDSIRAQKSHPTAESLPGHQEYVCWITDFLPEDISPSSRRSIRVFFYNHDSYWQRDAVQDRLWNLGYNLLHHISSRIRRTEEERSRRLIFVGHSYGGLVIKRALILSKSNPSPEIAEHTRAVLFLGTPHRGSSFTTWGTVIARVLKPLGSNPSILDELAYDSVSLLDLHREFMAVTQNGLRVINFFEQRKTSMLRFWFVRWDQFCVREQSATFEGHQVRNIGLGVDHYGMNKFGSRTSAYKIILSQLLELISPASSTGEPRSYSVPLETVHNYTERRNLSSAIEEKLRDTCTESSFPRALAICGLGGTGKTQLTLRLIEDHKDEYNPILWIDGKSPETVQSSFVRCAAELNLSVDQSSTQLSALEDSPTVQAVLRWLRDRNEFDDEWLVVIDNADDLSWGIKRVLPKGRRGNVVVTSQDDQSPKLFDRECEKLCVHTMEPSEARALLLRHLNWDSNLAPANIQDLSDKIVHLLGFLALAVDLAGAYIHEHSVKEDSSQEAALEQYLVDYGRHQDALLRKDFYRGLSSYDKTVWTVWDTTLETIERRYPEVQAGALLVFLARFNREIIQDELFRLASVGFSTARQEFCHEGQDLPDWLKGFIQLGGENWDSFRYREAVKLLIRYNLLQQVRGEWPGLSMHSLVQWRASNYKKDQAWDCWYLIFIVAVSYAMIFSETIPRFRRHIIPHILSIEESHFDNLQIDDERRVLVWYLMARIYNQERQLKEAGKLISQATETGKTVLGVEHPLTLNSMNTLATIHLKQGRWKEAEKLELQVLETSKRVLGAEHPLTSEIMNILALTYSVQGRWDEAEELSKEVLETRRRVLGAEHPEILTSMSNLVTIYQRQKKWKEAEKLNVQVLGTQKRVLGAEHEFTLRSINNLGWIYLEQGRLKEAEEVTVHALEARQRVLGAEHPDTVASMFDLACVYHDRGQQNDSILRMRTVLKHRMNLFGADHSYTLRTQDILQNWLDEEPSDQHGLDG